MIQDPTPRTPEDLGGAIDRHLWPFADAYSGDTLAQAGETLAVAAPFVSDEVIGMVEFLLAELRAVRPS